MHLDHVLMVALIQSATALPSFLLGLISGVMADLVDRRRYLLAVVSFMLVSAVSLWLFVAMDVVGPWMLIFFTFSMGVGFALQAPAWSTSQMDSVARALMPSAIALSALSYSSARALGPAMAGVVISGADVVTVFALCVGLLGLSFVALLLWKNSHQPSPLPPESLLSGLRSAHRYVRHSKIVKVQIVRTVAFTCAGSAVWALLPLFAEHQLNAGAGGYGLLLASMGAGAVVGALLVPRLKANFEINRMMAVATAVYGGVTLGVALVPSMFAVCAMLFVGGGAWLVVGNTNMLALQSSVPTWIRGRTLAVYMVVFQGAMAGASAGWGWVAGRIGTAETFVVSSVLMLVVMVLMRWFPARIADEAEATESSASLFPEIDPQRIPAGGVVAVQIDYVVEADQRDQFLHRLDGIGRVRRRDGASFWGVFCSVEDERRIVERFFVDSWDHYLRQRSRMTIADQNAERAMWELHVGDAPPAISHYVSVRGL
jgi:MFS family permease